jgi:hypothetical protein
MQLEAVSFRVLVLLLTAWVIVAPSAPLRAEPAGRLAEPGLTADRTAGDDVVLTWPGSCLASDIDFEVYEGALGEFSAHEAIACTTAGATTYTLTPSPGDRYFLVVPRNATREGSYGTDSAGGERPASAVACLQQEISECPTSAALHDIDSGQPNPTGNYRWMDVADQTYSTVYQHAYNYTQGVATVQFFASAARFHGVFTCTNLKPHFAYQVKLVGVPETPSNESIGLTGRWWQEEWNGSAWVNGQNLNNKGDGSSPNPNDQVYFSRRDIPDPTSPTGRKYRYTGYLPFEYFVTDELGRTLLSYEQNSSYHVLWKTSQRSRTAQDGPLKTTAFDVVLPDPVSAYDVDYPPATVTIFGEWERLPIGGVTLPPGAYEADFMLTEESFHGSGLAGGWAAAMGVRIQFEILAARFPPTF